MDIEIIKLRLYQGLSEDLRKWFKDGGWNRYNTKGEKVGKCARDDKDGDGKADGPKPKCLPASKAASLGKKKVAAAVKRKRSEDPNPNRTGAAKNVNTESIEHIKEFVGTAIAGTAGAATAKPKDRARKALGTAAGYAVGATLGKMAGGAVGQAAGKAAGGNVAGANLPLVGGGIKAAGQAAGGALGKGTGQMAGGIAGGVGGAVAGNKLAGSSKKKRQNESFQSFQEKAQKCWDTHKKVGMKMKGGKMVNDCRPK